MITLHVPDMGCDHCVQTITKTVRALDGDAAINADLGMQTVTIDTKVDSVRVTAALEQAGYPARVQ